MKALLCLMMALPLCGATVPRTLPLTFERNRGQADARVQFLARGNRFHLLLTADEAVLVFNRRTIRLRNVGGNRTAVAEGIEPLAARSHYFIGSWRVHADTFGRVRYRDVYPGIDLVYYGNQGELEYDYLVAPGADPRRIGLAFEGAESLRLDARGDLLIEAGGVPVRQRRPRVFQEIAGRRREIAGRYVLRGRNQAGFEVGPHDPTRALIIDPVLNYASYLGSGGDEEGYSIAVDAAGYAYVTGNTCSFDFPVTSGAAQPKYGGVLSCNAFVSKLNLAAAGPQALVYSTFLGGSGREIAYGIAIDAAGNAYVAGTTTSANFPTTSGAAQTKFGGGKRDGFVSVINPDGSALVYSTLLGGSGAEYANGIAVDSSGKIFVVGETTSGDFPVTADALQPDRRGPGDVFLAKLDPTIPGKDSLLYSSYFGGSGDDLGYAIALDSDGRPAITGATDSTDLPTTEAAFQTASRGGDEAFVAKFAATGRTLEYATYLGGALDEFGQAIAVDAAGNCYVTGYAESPDIAAPSQPRAEYKAGGDVFLAKLGCRAGGSDLLAFTYLGGRGEDEAFAIAVDAAGNVYVAGWTDSDDFFGSEDALQSKYGGGDSDGFLAVFNENFDPVYSTYFGGRRADRVLGVAIGLGGEIHLVGTSKSSDLPVTEGAFQAEHKVLPSFPDSDVFILKVLP